MFCFSFAYWSRMNCKHVVCSYSRLPVHCLHKIRTKTTGKATLPIFKWTGETKVVTKLKQAEQAAEALKQEPILGFDVEMNGKGKKAVLMQLASKKCVYLVRLNPSMLSPLIPLLQNGKIKKVGVGIIHDVKKVQDCLQFSPEGFVEISDSTKRANLTKHGVQSLAEIFLKKRVTKNVPNGKWTDHPLSVSQINYAATDASACRAIYLKVTHS